MTTKKTAKQTVTAYTPGKAKAAKESLPASTDMTTYDDGKFVRTAIVVKEGGAGGSLDIVDSKGRRIGQLNIFVQEGEEPSLMVDIIDVDHVFEKHRALGFVKYQRNDQDTDQLVGADFRGAAKNVTTKEQRFDEAKARTFETHGEMLQALGKR